MSKAASRQTKRGRGFERTAGLLADRFRQAGEKRGFAVSRVLTHWAEVVGDEIAALSRPVKVSYAREGFGGTLTLLCAGAAAPLVQMRTDEIKARVNGCYGYNAISHVRITQTSAAGFAEPAAAFMAAPSTPPAPAPERVTATLAPAGDIDDPGLRAALERLATNVLARRGRD